MVSDEVAVVSAARYTVVASEDLDLPLGLGSRHMAGSSISLRTDGVAVVMRGGRDRAGAASPSETYTR